MNTAAALKTPAELVSITKACVTTCTPREASARISADKSVIVVDVREPEEYQQAHIMKATNIPRGLLEWKIAEASADVARPILVHCASGGRAALAAKSLLDMGYQNVTAVDGSYADFSACMAEIASATPGQRT